MKKILFLGSKPIGYFCLDYLNTHTKSLDIEIVGLLTNDNQRFKPGLSLLVYADANNIPVIADLDDIIELADIDFIISVQYHRILKKRHIQVAKRIAINLHMAPLPEFQGCNQFSFAIFTKSPIFGTTIHRLEESVDGGDIIVEKRFKIPENCYVEDLYKLTVNESKYLFQEEIGNILDDNYTLTPQSSFIHKRNSNIYYRRDINILKDISIKSAPNEIDRKIRATCMPGFEMPSINIGDNKYYIVPERYYQVNAKEDK